MEKITKFNNNLIDNLIKGVESNYGVIYYYPVDLISKISEKLFDTKYINQPLIVPSLDNLQLLLIPIKNSYIKVKVLTETNTNIKETKNEQNKLLISVSKPQLTYGFCNDIELSIVNYKDNFYKLNINIIKGSE